MKKITLVICVMVLAVCMYSCDGDQLSPEAEDCLPKLIGGPCTDTLKSRINSISVSDAAEMNKRYRDAVTNGFDSATVWTLSETFSRDAIFDLLKRDSTVGIRFYLGLNSDKELKIIMAGVKPDCSNWCKFLEMGLPGTDSISKTCQ